MSKFNFTKDEVEYFIDKCMLNDELAIILKLLNMGYSRIQVLMELQKYNYFMSESTLDRKIKTIKKKIIRVI
jgi:hypothetical protein